MDGQCYSDPRILYSLQAHYLGVLKYLISSRTKQPDLIFALLEEFFVRLENLHKLHAVYHAKSIGDSPNVEAADAFAALVSEDKGLLPQVLDVV